MLCKGAAAGDDVEAGVVTAGAAGAGATGGVGADAFAALVQGSCAMNAPGI